MMGMSGWIKFWSMYTAFGTEKMDGSMRVCFSSVYWFFWSSLFF